MWVLREENNDNADYIISIPISPGAPAVTGSIVMSAADIRTWLFRRQSWLQADAFGTSFMDF